MDALNNSQSSLRIAPTVDLVLLSHGDLAHSGLYPYAYSRWNLKATAYSTLPVQAMGKIAAIEDVEGLRDEQDIGDEPIQEGEHNGMHPEDNGEIPHDAPYRLQTSSGRYISTLVEVQDAFEHLNTLRYSQPTHLQGMFYALIVWEQTHFITLGKCQGITITPFNAGHSLGGTIWKIRSPTSGTIIYAVNMNHMKERHLDGTVLMRNAGGEIFEPLARPDLLITDAGRGNVITSRRKDRDAALIGELDLGLNLIFGSWFSRYNNCNTFLSVISFTSL